MKFSGHEIKDGYDTKDFSVCKTKLDIEGWLNHHLMSTMI